MSVALILLAAQALCPTMWAASRRPLELEDLFRAKRLSDPQISPDGKWIAYVVVEVDKPENRLNTDIWLVSIDGGEARALTSSPRHDRHPRWSPDGRGMAFESNRSGEFQIYVIRADGGEAAKLTSISTEANQPIWSPDGRHIAFVSAVFREFSDKPFKDSDAANKKKLEEREKSKVKAHAITRRGVEHQSRHLRCGCRDGRAPAIDHPSSRRRFSALFARWKIHRLSRAVSLGF